MKYFSALLTIYLGCLTIAPAFVKLLPCAGMAAEQSCGKDCKSAANDCKGEQQDKDQNCPFGICCNNCLFYYTDSGNFEFIKLSSSKEKIDTANEIAISIYSADCWHPPEIA